MLILFILFFSDAAVEELVAFPSVVAVSLNVTTVTVEPVPDVPVGNISSIKSHAADFAFLSLLYSFILEDMSSTNTTSIDFTGYSFLLTRISFLTVVSTGFVGSPFTYPVFVIFSPITSAVLFTVTVNDTDLLSPTAKSPTFHVIVVPDTVPLSDIVPFFNVVYCGTVSVITTEFATVFPVFFVVIV